MALEVVRGAALLHRWEEGQRASTSSEGEEEVVVLGCSGGVNSRVLLRLARLALLPASDPRSRKPREVQKLVVVYIDDGLLLPGSEKKDDRAERVRAMVEDEGGEAAGLSFVSVPIEDAFEEEGEAFTRSTLLESGTVEQRRRRVKVQPGKFEAGEMARRLFATLRPERTPRGAQSNARTRVEDMHELLVGHLLRREAKRRNACAIVTAENATRMAIRTVEAVAKGRGHKLPLDEANVRWNGVCMLRPMREMVAKEMTYYARVTGLDGSRSATDVVGCLTPSDAIASEMLSRNRNAVAGLEGANGDKASIARLTESLIHLLEKNVPSTVTTVNKTTSKLVFADDEATHGYEAEGQTQTHYQRIVNRPTESNSNSFEEVGPSVPLSKRSQQTSSTFEEETIAMGAQIGIKGSSNRLLSLARSLPQWTESMSIVGGCALCGMPRQRGLQAWRRGLTVTPAIQAEEQTMQHSNGTGEEDDDLDEHLCYGCSLILDLGDDVQGPAATIDLPLFVADRIAASKRAMQSTLPEQQQLQQLASLSLQDSLKQEEDLNGESLSQEGTTNGRPRGKREALVKVDRGTMRQQLDGFLLPEEETEAESQEQVEAKRMDW